MMVLANASNPIGESTHVKTRRSKGKHRYRKKRKSIHVFVFMLVLLCPRLLVFNKVLPPAFFMISNIPS